MRWWDETCWIVVLNLDSWCWVVAWIGDLKYRWMPCKRDISRPPFAQHSRYALGFPCCTTPWYFVGPRGVVRGLPRSFAVLRLCLSHHNPHAIVDWRDGFISPCRWNGKNDVSESSKIAPTRNWRWFFQLYITWTLQQIKVCKNLGRLQTSSLFRWKNTSLHYQPTSGGEQPPSPEGDASVVQSCCRPWHSSVSSARCKGKSKGVNSRGGWWAYNHNYSICMC